MFMPTTSLKLPEEKRATFLEDARASREEALDSGEGYAAEDVHSYLRARAYGKAVSKPETKPWRG
jgi:hypothetical protein